MLKLIEEVKNYVDFTWEDPAEERKLIGIVERAKAYFCRLLDNKDFDFSVESFEKQLFLDYCRYAFCGALNDFFENYQTELLAVQVGSEAGSGAGEI